MLTFFYFGGILSSKFCGYERGIGGMFGDVSSEEGSDLDALLKQAMRAESLDDLQV